MEDSDGNCGIIKGVYTWGIVTPNNRVLEADCTVQRDMVNGNATEGAELVWGA